jgi:hypothetical protein
MELALKVVKALQKHESAAFFLEPIRKKEVPDYFHVIKRPMDLQTVRYKLDGLEYNTLGEVMADIDLIWNNSLEHVPKLFRVGVSLVVACSCGWANLRSVP